MYLIDFSFILLDMDYSNVDFEDLLDTSSDHDLVPTYLRPT